MHLRFLSVIPWVDRYLFLSLNNIPMCGYVTAYLSNRLLNTISVISSDGAHKKAFIKHMSTFLCGHIFSGQSGNYQGGVCFFLLCGKILFSFVRSLLSAFSGFNWSLYTILFYL